MRRLTDAAEEDLLVARMCVEHQPQALRGAAFHSQQCAEKYLKAWLVALGSDDPPYTHNQVELGVLLRDRRSVPPPEVTLAFLSRFAVRPRYGVGGVTLADGERALADAAAVAELARAGIAAVGHAGPSA